MTIQVLAIDPAPTESAYVMWDGSKIYEMGIVDNWLLRRKLDFDDIDECLKICPNYWVIEKVMSYGMSVGESVFETVFWTGVFSDTIGSTFIDSEPYFFAQRIPRMDVKMHLCHSSRASDANISQALKDRFEPDLKPRQRPRGTLKGVKKDIWAALALAVTFWDVNCAKNVPVV